MDSSNMIKAAAVMVAGMLLIPLGDTAGKLLIGFSSVEPFFVAWSRFVLGAIMIFALMGGRGFEWRVFYDWRIWFRGSLVVCAISSILTSLSTEPISDVFAAFFIGPIISYFVSAWLLGEPISKARTALLFVGFCGVLLVVKPGVNTSPGMAFALLAGMFYGSFLVASKWLSHVTSSNTLLLSQLLVGSLLLFPLGISSVPEFDLNISLLVLLSAFASGLGNLFLIVANRMADASRLAPLVYVQLLSATVLGVLVFNEYPDIVSLAGLVLLLSAGFGSYFIANKKA